MGHINQKVRVSNWKSSGKCNAVSFRQFIHQLRAHAKGRKLVLIMDNVSYHDSKLMKLFREKYDDVEFFFLPPYSPEYNPTEQVLKWRKLLVHAAKTIKGGLDEILSRFRKLFANRRDGRLATTLNAWILKAIH